MEYRLVEPNVVMVKFIKEGTYILSLGARKVELEIAEGEFKLKT